MSSARSIAPPPAPYNYKVETYYDANRNVVRVDTEDQQVAYESGDPTDALYARFTPSGNGISGLGVAQVPSMPGDGGSLRPGWFSNLYTFDLLDNKISQDIDATGSDPASLVTTYLYDANENLVTVTKPQGNTVENDFDERNLRIAQRVGYVSPAQPGAVRDGTFINSGKEIFDDPQRKVTEFAQDGKKSVWMSDVPGIQKVNQRYLGMSFEFQTYVVCVDGEDKGKVLFGLSWGFSIDAKGNITSMPEHYLYGAGPDYAPAKAKWDAQAVAPRGSVKNDLEQATFDASNPPPIAH